MLAAAWTSQLLSRRFAGESQRVGTSNLSCSYFFGRKETIEHGEWSMLNYLCTYRDLFDNGVALNTLNQLSTHIESVDV
jgi:hypothetical protein